MDHSTADPYKIFDLLRKRVSFKLCIKSVKPNEILLRSTVKSIAQATSIIEAYESIINCKFHVVNSRSKRSSATKKKWVCTHRQTTKCPGNICILIKKVCKQNLKNDAFLRRSLPFRGVIRINPNHNHSCTIVEDKPPTPSVSQRYHPKVNNDVKHCFYEYFKRGITGAEAKAMHEYNLHKANFHYLGDPSMNPSLKTVNSFYDSWLKLKENVCVNKVVLPTHCVAIKILNIESSNRNQSSSNFVDMNVLANIKKEPESDSSDENITEDITSVSVFDCKKEVDDDTGLPVISSYGTLKQPLLPPPVIQNVASMQMMPTEISASDSAEDTSKSALLGVNCKKEIETDVDDGLPVISSYGSLAEPQLQLPLAKSVSKLSKPYYRNIAPRPPSQSVQQPALQSAPQQTPQSIPLLVPQPAPCAGSVSQAKTSAAKNVTPMVNYKPSTSKVVVYDPSSNTYKVANCVALSAYTPGISAYSSSQYNAHLPGALLSTRVVLPKL